jgi:hypothetical protein
VLDFNAGYAANAEHLRELEARDAELRFVRNWIKQRTRMWRRARKRSRRPTYLSKGGVRK